MKDESTALYTWKYIQIIALLKLLLLCKFNLSLQQFSCCGFCWPTICFLQADSCLLSRVYYFIPLTHFVLTRFHSFHVRNRHQLARPDSSSMTYTPVPIPSYCLTGRQARKISLCSAAWWRDLLRFRPSTNRIFIVYPVASMRCRNHTHLLFSTSMLFNPLQAASRDTQARH